MWDPISGHGVWAQLGQAGWHVMNSGSRADFVHTGQQHLEVRCKLGRPSSAGQRGCASARIIALQPWDGMVENHMGEKRYDDHEDYFDPFMLVNWSGVPPCSPHDIRNGDIR